MARRSARTSDAGGTISKHKRAASGSAVVATTSKRPKRQQATPTKSQYFQDDDKDPEDEEESEPPSPEVSTSEFGGSGEASAKSSEPEEDEEEEDESDNATPRGKGSSKTTQVWKPGTKTGLGPGQQLVIKKPMARPAGKTPYTDETVHPNTMLFLGDLKKNNERSWLKLHDAEYRQAEKDWHSFVEKMTEKLTEIDDTVPELPVKDVIFRIYRDVRFSKDSTPYKPWFSAAWSRTGRKSTYAHYYVQIAPNKSFVGGGMWQPEAQQVSSMRAAIDTGPRALKDVLADAAIRREFLDSSKNNDAAVVKEFVKNNSQNALKTKPKGFDGDHPDIELLRLRNYTLGHTLSDEEVLGEKGTQRIAELFAALQPFITYLNSVVMPDHNAEQSSEESDEDDEEEGSDEEEESS